MGYPSYLEDIREEIEGHFDPMSRDGWLGMSNELPVRKGERVKLRADKITAETTNMTATLELVTYISDTVGIVDHINRSIAKVMFRVKDKRIIMELPLTHLERVS